MIFYIRELVIAGGCKNTIRLQFWYICFINIDQTCKMFIKFRLFSFFLNSDYDTVSSRSGSHRYRTKELNVDNVRRYQIPMPPLAEQEEIARRLDVCSG